MAQMCQPGPYWANLRERALWWDWVKEETISWSLQWQYAIHGGEWFTLFCPLVPDRRKQAYCILALKTYINKSYLLWIAYWEKVRESVSASEYNNVYVWRESVRESVTKNFNSYNKVRDRQYPLPHCVCSVWLHGTLTMGVYDSLARGTCSY